MDKNSKKQKSIYQLAVCGVLIALAAGLSNIKVIQMPLGGSVTLCSMVPIVLIAIMYGVGWGYASAFVYSLIQLFFGITMSGLLGWGLTSTALIGVILFDYILPFTFLGTAGFAAKKGYGPICVGIIVSVVLRFICHFLSGWIFLSSWSEWKNIPLYSFCYNGAYMLPELVITVICAFLLFRSKQIRKIAGI